MLIGGEKVGRQPRSFWTAGGKAIVGKWRSSEYSEAWLPVLLNSRIMQALVTDN